MQVQPRIPDSAQSAHDKVYRGLRTRILHGQIAPGAALTLRGIGREFGVSMTPAREAVQRGWALSPESATRIDADRDAQGALFGRR